MSERSPFTPSGILARALKFTAQHTPKGWNIAFAAGYGVCECLGASALFSTFWSLFQAQLKGALNASKVSGSDKQGTTAGEPETPQGNLL